MNDPWVNRDQAEQIANAQRRVEWQTRRERVDRLISASSETPPARPVAPTCSWTDCKEPCEPIVRVGYPLRHTGRCKHHGEIEYSKRWLAQMAAVEVSNDERARGRLYAERQRWEAAGHVFWNPKAGGRP